MLATDLIGKSKQEIKELLLFNTKEYRFDEEVLAGGHDVIYDVFGDSGSYLVERQAFWQTILHGMYSIELEIVSTIVEQLGAFEFITFCENNFGDKKEIELYRTIYSEYRDKQESVASLITQVLGAFVDDLGDIQPEEINKIISELNLNLDQLPDFIKNAVK
jgi:hypothetical protein